MWLRPETSETLQVWLGQPGRRFRAEEWGPLSSGGTEGSPAALVESALAMWVGARSPCCYHPRTRFRTGPLPGPGGGWWWCLPFASGVPKTRMGGSFELCKYTPFQASGWWYGFCSCVLHTRSHTPRHTSPIPFPDLTLTPLCRAARAMGRTSPSWGPRALCLRPRWHLSQNAPAPAA